MPATCEARMPEMKMLIWVALLAIAAGTARRIRSFISEVRRGRTSRIRAPEARAPHQQMPAWPIPAITTPALAHQAACTGSDWGNTIASITRFRIVGYPAETMNRPRALSTPENSAAIAMQGR
jgi:hypothetical protein